MRSEIARAGMRCRCHFLVVGSFAASPCSQAYPPGPKPVISEETAGPFAVAFHILVRFMFFGATGVSKGISVTGVPRHASAPASSQRTGPFSVRRPAEKMSSKTLCVDVHHPVSGSLSALTSTLSTRLPSRSTTSKRQPIQSTASAVCGKRPSNNMIIPANVL